MLLIFTGVKQIFFKKPISYKYVLLRNFADFIENMWT
jgi:hypothetical protein